MNPGSHLSLFIFRRDLRIHDNTGLLAAAQNSSNVIPCFIIDPVQITKTNQYRSLNAIQFMRQAIADLQAQIAQHKGKLYVFYGKPYKIISELLDALPIGSVHVNRDYTPFSIKRDEAIEKTCLKKNVAFHKHNDLLLTEPGQIMTSNNTPYSKFTPFFKKALKQPIRDIQHTKISNWYLEPVQQALTSTDSLFEPYENKKLHVVGSRAAAQEILEDIGSFTDYDATHDIPSIDTTNLSAYLKFGLVSVRQVYHTLHKVLGDTPLIRQLYWRDFFVHIAYNNPSVFGMPYQEKYAYLPWQNNKKKFQAWCNGETGFPIIDAGMRQLNQTGYMHNRVRLLTGSFLVKDLHIDWRWGERYFARQLVDYDPSVNNGNWQWVASTGTDSQPYFRIFNPWIQQKRFDPEAVYIKQWVPELQEIPAKTIHKLNKNIAARPKNYPKPIVDHKAEAAKTKQIYKLAI